MGPRSAFRPLEAIPESNDRVNARTRFNRTCVIARVRLYPKASETKFGPPVARELSFLLRSGIAYKDRPRVRGDLALRTVDLAIDSQQRRAKSMDLGRAMKPTVMTPVHMTNYHSVLAMTIEQVCRPPFPGNDPGKKVNFYLRCRDGAAYAMAIANDAEAEYKLELLTDRSVRAMISQFSLDGVVADSIDRPLAPTSAARGQQMTVLSKGGHILMRDYTGGYGLAEGATLWLIWTRVFLDLAVSANRVFKMPSPDVDLTKGGVEFEMPGPCVPPQPKSSCYVMVCYVLATEGKEVPDKFRTHTLEKLGFPETMRVPNVIQRLGRIEHLLDEDPTGHRPQVQHYTRAHPDHPHVSQDAWAISQERAPIQVLLAPDF